MKSFSHLLQEELHTLACVGPCADGLAPIDAILHTHVKTLTKKNEFCIQGKGAIKATEEITQRATKALHECRCYGARLQEEARGLLRFMAYDVISKQSVCMQNDACVSNAIHILIHIHKWIHQLTEAWDDISKNPQKYIEHFPTYTFLKTLQHKNAKTSPPVYKCVFTHTRRRTCPYTHTKQPSLSRPIGAGNTRGYPHTHTHTQGYPPPPPHAHTHTHAANASRDGKLTIQCTQNLSWRENGVNNNFKNELKEKGVNNEIKKQSAEKGVNNEIKKLSAEKGVNYIIKKQSAEKGVNYIIKKQSEEKGVNYYIEKELKERGMNNNIKKELEERGMNNNIKKELNTIRVKEVQHIRICDSEEEASEAVMLQGGYDFPDDITKLNCNIFKNTQIHLRA